MGNRTPSHLPTIDPAFDVELALLDEQGVIVAVNESWAAFCLYNGGDPQACGIGMNYLEVCDENDDEPVSAHVAAVIRRAMSGQLVVATSILIACHAPTELRWFEMIVSPRPRMDRRLGATLMLARVAAPASPEPPLLRRDRSRDARDAHDVVIEHIYAAGLAMRGLAPAPWTSRPDAMLDRILDELDAAIDVLRQVALDDLHQPG